MTEQEWLVSTDPAAMLRYANSDGGPYGPWQDPQAKITHQLLRKMRLFACACLGLARGLEWEHLDDFYRLAEAGETPGYLRWGLHGLACSPIEQATAWTTGHHEPPTAAQKAAFLRDIFGNPFRPVRVMGWATDELAIDQHSFASWLAWNDHTIPRLAQAAYDERNPDGTLDTERLAVLADALEEAGCANEAILMHLRSMKREICNRCEGDGKAHGADRPFEWSPDVDYGRCVICKGTGLSGGWVRSAASHVRGCWVIDLLLGKE